MGTFDEKIQFVDDIMSKLENQYRNTKMHKLIISAYFEHEDKNSPINFRDYHLNVNDSEIADSLRRAMVLYLGLIREELERERQKDKSAKTDR